MKKVVFALFFLPIIFYENADAQQLVRGLGISSGFTTTAPAKVLHPQPNTLPLFTDSFNRESKNAFLVGLSLPVYLKLFQFNKENSLAFQSVSLLGAYVGGTNFEDEYDSFYGTFGPYGVPIFVSIPLVLQYSRGLFSTVESLAERGVGIGLGLEYQIMLDQFAHYPKAPTIATYEVGSTILWRPVAQIAYRYWTASNLLAEVSLQASYWRDNFLGQNIPRPTFRLTWAAYFNY